MSTTPRPLLLSNADLGYVKDTHTPEQVRDIYEAARAKDAQLIQMLVDALNDSCDDLRGLLNVISPMDRHMINMSVEVYQDALDIAIAAGFKPTEP